VTPYALEASFMEFVLWELVLVIIVAVACTAYAMWNDDDKR
jgi:hypothetical protein